MKRIEINTRLFGDGCTVSLVDGETVRKHRVPLPCALEIYEAKFDAERFYERCVEFTGEYC